MALRELPARGNMLFPDKDSSTALTEQGIVVQDKRSPNSNQCTVLRICAAFYMPKL